MKFSSAGSLLDETTVEGMLSYPTGIATDVNGSIWLADTGNNRVLELDAQGEYVTSFGSEGSEAGQFAGPEGIAVDSGGNVWVADTYNNRIQKFDPQGEFLLQATGGEGEFGNPTAIAVDAEGGVWVADTYNDRVQHFDAEGGFLGQFGSSGSTDGEFSYPMGIEADVGGRIWVSDTESGRVQKWVTSSGPDGAYFVGEFGSKGSAPGQLSNPSGVAADSEGDLWVSDTANNRLQVLGAEGEFIRQVGSLGTGNGQFSSPHGVAVDGIGNIWVADTGNNRIQELDSEGKFIRTLGTSGSANGQFKSPYDVAVDGSGNVWVADLGNARVQEFGASGQFIRAFGSQGSGNGQFLFLTGIAVDRRGDVWVADLGNNRIQEFTSQGAFIRKVGTAGSGQAQFNGPSDLTFDEDGNIWVVDSSNDRIQGFGPAGNYLMTFGTSGSNPNQFVAPSGLGSDAEGNLWVVDSSTSSVKHWWPYRKSPEQEAELLPPEDDAQVDVGVAAGLVQSVEGEEAGQHTYAHSSDDLISHVGPQGTSSYEYDSAGRMTKVTLVNGTWASITYEATLGRVRTVTVDPAGAEPAKKTEFEYTDAPTRRTVVIPPDAPHVTYDIGDDGSVLKWWNALQPPVFDDLAGSLYASKDKEDALVAGDQYLDIQAHSDEGISSIQVIANGNQLVHETNCEQTEDPGIECETVASEWVTNTDVNPPGHLDLEVVITDRLGQRSGERFWVDIPEPPPPAAPGTPIPPKFADVLKFREDYGLEIVFPVANEIQRNERIFNLINAWYEGDPVARASWERWGVPLRAADIAELEYRIAYWRQAVTAIPAWIADHASAQFAGVYLDDRAGGKIRIGFTGGPAAQENLVQNLRNSGVLVAGDRLMPFVDAPLNSMTQLESLAEQVWSNIESFPPNVANRASIDVKANRVSVVASNVSQAQSLLMSEFGSDAPLEVAVGEPLQPRGDRERVNGPMLAGDRVWTKEPNGEEWGCSAGVGAYDYGTNPITQAVVLRMFFLLAAHCAEEVPGSTSYRQAKEEPAPKQRQKLGSVKRTGWDQNNANVDVDVQAVRYENVSGIEPRRIFNPQEGGLPIPITGRGYVGIGTRVCYSGATTDEVHPFGGKCGTVFDQTRYIIDEDRPNGAQHSQEGWCFDRRTEEGDSGGPVWIEGTGLVVGLVSVGDNVSTCFAPLLPDPNHPSMPSGLTDDRLAPLDGITQVP